MPHTAAAGMVRLSSTATPRITGLTPSASAPPSAPTAAAAAPTVLPAQPTVKGAARTKQSPKVTATTAGRLCSSAAFSPSIPLIGSATISINIAGSDTAGPNSSATTVILAM